MFCNETYGDDDNASLFVLVTDILTFPKTQSYRQVQKFQLPCQNGCRNDQIALQQHQKPNKNRNGPESPKSQHAQNL